MQYTLGRRWLAYQTHGLHTTSGYHRGLLTRIMCENNPGWARNNTLDIGNHTVVLDSRFWSRGVRKSSDRRVTSAGFLATVSLPDIGLHCLMVALVAGVCVKSVVNRPLFCSAKSCVL